MISIKIQIQDIFESINGFEEFKKLIGTHVPDLEKRLCKISLLTPKNDHDYCKNRLTPLENQTDFGVVITRKIDPKNSLALNPSMIIGRCFSSESGSQTTDNPRLI